MNLFRAQKALLAIERREGRRLSVRRPANAADVREMVEAGLLDAAPSDGSTGTPTVLMRLTDAGRRFLQMFPARYRFCQAS